MTVNSLHKQGTFLKETLCLELNTNSSSPTTPRFIRPLTTERTTSSHHFFHGKFCSKCVFSVLGHCRKHGGCEPANWGLLTKSLLKSDILKTHRRKHVGCWFSHHSSQLLSLSSNYSEETPCLDHLTRSSSHRTPRVIMPCLVMQFNMLRKTTSLQFHRQKVV